MNNDIKDLKGTWCLGYVKDVVPRNAQGAGGSAIALISYYVLTREGQLEEERYYFASPVGQKPKYLSVCASTLEALGYSIDKEKMDDNMILEAFNDLRASKTEKRGVLVWAKIGLSSIGIHTNYFEKVTSLSRGEEILASWLKGLAAEDLAREYNKV